MIKKSTLATAIVFLPFLLSAQVSQQWATRYSATTGTDKAYALALDDSGNVYVTGSSVSAGFGTEDYTTVKYNASGVELWVKKYNGLGTSLSTDIAHAIVTDKRGYIYVTGESTSAIGTRDYLTIKYNAAGDTMWTARYNGSKNANDIAYDIAVSDSGNVYVTGSSEGLVGTHGIFEDYVTVKYDSTGVQKWAASYNGPGGDFDAAASVAVDRTGNVYVTGESGGGSTGSSDTYADYATLKYNSIGVAQWTKRYTGAFVTTSDDRANQLKIDRSGNVHVTGKSTGMTTGHDYVTVKYNAATGVELWAARYNGAGDNEDEGKALALDDSGNVYVVGNSYSGTVNGNDIVTVKYSYSGTEQWAKAFNGTGSGNDGGRAIAVDSATADVFVTGYSTSTGDFDYATIKYNRAGIFQWSILYTNSGAAGSSEDPAGIRVDKSGNVYVTGLSGLDYATVKYAQSVGVHSVKPARASWIVSPNPVSKAIFLKSDNAAAEASHVRITNLPGQQVYNELVQGNEHVIDVTKWPVGLYFVTLGNSEHRQAIRVMIYH